MMRLLLVLAIGLQACGGSKEDNDTDLSLNTAVSEENFRDKFAERFCAEYRQCKPGAPCVVSEVQAGNDTGEDCAFSQSAGQACLDAAWPCLADIADPYLDIPLVCEEVWECD